MAYGIVRVRDIIPASTDRILVLFDPGSLLYRFSPHFVGGKDMPKAQFEMFKEASGKFRFRLRAPNGEVIASSEAYESKDACKKGITSVKRNAPKAIVQDFTG